MLAQDGQFNSKNKMNTNFYSALALFQSLFKAKKGDIYTIINRFIIIAVKNKISFSIEDIAPALKKQFQIEIPLAVIRKCIGQENYKYNKGKFFLTSQYDGEIEQLSKELADIDSTNENVISDFLSFLGSKLLSELTDKEKSVATKQFYDYIVDKDTLSSSLPYYKFITEFIINHENDEHFQSTLDNLKEGIVIYNGIKYSNGSNDKTWKKEIVFFLDLEYLFSSYGMNGLYYKECFFDFHNLVKKINDGCPRKNNTPRISLCYFHSTKERMDKFFCQAQRIKLGQEQFSDMTEAMEFILNKSHEESDILLFKANFIKHLESLGITEYDEEIRIEENENYLFETQELKEEIKSEFTECEDKAIEMLRYADYINILRQGQVGKDMETCRYVFLSDGNIPTKLSMLLRVKYPDTANYLMCRMELFTERMWFNLKQGIVSDKSLASFKVLMKAKRIISGLLDDKVFECYEKIKTDAKETDNLRGYYEELRKERRKPEDVNKKVFENKWLYEDVVEGSRKYNEEQSALRQKVDEVEMVKKDLEQTRATNKSLSLQNNQLSAELKRHKYQALLQKRKKAKSRYCIIGCLVNNLNAIFVMLLAIMFVLLFVNSIAGIVGGVLSLLGIFANETQTVKKYIRRKSRRIYVNILKSIEV